MKGKRNQRHEKQSSVHLLNEQIHARFMRLITYEGENIERISREEALQIAREAHLDLVQLGKIDDEMPVVKIMDYGKFLYEKKKKAHDAKKHQKIVQLKEVKLRPNIGDADYQIKLKRAIGFLNDGKKVKFTLQFKGREKIMVNDLGPKFFLRLSQDLENEGIRGILEEKESRSKHFWSKIVSIKNK